VNSTDPAVDAVERDVVLESVEHVPAGDASVAFTGGSRRVDRATMSLFGQLTRAFVVNRMARGGGRRRQRPYTRGHSRRSSGRGGFFGPVPYYSRRTRGGSRVAVSGCCLPIPLGAFGALAVGARLMSKR